MERMRSTDATQRSGALDEFCRSYWPPLYTFARSLGHSPHDAEDFVQSFVSKLLEDESLHSTAPERGQLRTFLRTAFRNHIADANRVANRQKRGGGILHITIDLTLAERLFSAHDAAVAPDAAYDRQWTHTLLGVCISRLRETYTARGKAALFQELEPHIEGEPGDSSAAIAARLGMSDVAVRTSLKRMREQFRETLRAEVATTLNEGDDVDAEQRLLHSLMG